MPFEMRLWQVTPDALRPVPASGLDQEGRLENWIAKDPAILGMELVIIGRQVQTEYGGRIDLLAIDCQGSCVIIELKRARTPREVVAQLLDYASWVSALDYKDFVVDDQGKTLLELPLEAPRVGENSESRELSEWAVGVRWLKTVDREQAKTFKGAFANQNIVCKLRDPKTLEFLQAEFGVD